MDDSNDKLPTKIAVKYCMLILLKALRTKPNEKKLAYVWQLKAEKNFDVRNKMQKCKNLTFFLFEIEKCRYTDVRSWYEKFLKKSDTKKFGDCDVNLVFNILTLRV